jgi:hypothetical protein
MKYNKSDRTLIKTKIIIKMDENKLYTLHNVWKKKSNLNLHYSQQIYKRKKIQIGQK